MTAINSNTRHDGIVERTHMLVSRPDRTALLEAEAAKRGTRRGYVAAVNRSRRSADIEAHRDAIIAEADALRDDAQQLRETLFALLIVHTVTPVVQR